MVSKFKKNKRGKNKKSIKSIFFLSFLAFLFIFIVGFLFYSNYKINQRRNSLTVRITELRSQVGELEKLNQDLKEGIIDIESEDYLEKVARNQLGMRRPDEEVVVIQTEEAEDEWIEEKKTWWDKIKDFWK